MQIKRLKEITSKENAFLHDRTRRIAVGLIVKVYDLLFCRVWTQWRGQTPLRQSSTDLVICIVRAITRKVYIFLIILKHEMSGGFLFWIGLLASSGNEYARSAHLPPRPPQ